MIEDEMIPTADPEELIRQYEPLLWKLSGRYGRILEKLPDVDRDDLMQAGRMVIFRCQSEYDPTQASFLSFIYDRCRAAMRNVIGFRQDGSLPPLPTSLDKPIPGSEDEFTMLDTIPDPHPGPEEVVTDAEERAEISKAVRDAVERLENERQREAVRRIWLDEQPRTAAAEAMGITTNQLNTLDCSARRKLRQDSRLGYYYMPFFKVGPKAFQNTWTSAVEKSVLWLESFREKEAQASGDSFRKAAGD